MLGQAFDCPPSANEACPAASQQRLRLALIYLHRMQPPAPQCRRLSGGSSTRRVASGLPGFHPPGNGVGAGVKGLVNAAPTSACLANHYALWKFQRDNSAGGR